MSLNKQDLMLVASEEDLYVQSLADYVEKRIDNMDELFGNLLDIPDDDTTPIPPYQGNDLIIPVMSNGVYKFTKSSSVYNAVCNGSDDITLLDEDGNETSETMPTDNIIDMISQSIDTLQLTSAALRSASDSYHQEMDDVMTNFTSRIQLTYGGMSQSSKMYGVKMASILGSVGTSIRDRADAILDYVGIKKTNSIEEMPVPSSEFTDITGANPWITLLAASVSPISYAIVCGRMAAKYGKKVAAALKNSSAFRKVKRFFGDVVTISDAFNYKFFPKEFPGFGDYAVRCRVDTNRFSSYFGTEFMNWLSSSSYIRIDLPLGRLYLHKDANNPQYFYTQYFVIPTSTKQLSDGYSGYDNNDQVRSIELGNIETIANFCSYLTASGYVEHTIDKDVYDGVALAHVVNANFLARLALGDSISDTIVHEYLHGLVPNWDTSSVVPSNPTNLQLLKVIIGQDDLSSPFTDINSSSPEDIDWATAIYQLYLALQSEDQYLPYIHTNVLPTGRYSVKTDLQAMVPVLITVIAIVVVTISVLTGVRIGQLRKKQFVLEAKAGTLSWRAFDPDLHLSPSAQKSLLNAAYKAQKKANRIDRIIGATSSTVELTTSRMIQAMTNTVNASAATYYSILSDGANSDTPTSGDTSLLKIGRLLKQNFPR